MRIEPLGDSAFIVRELGDIPSYSLAKALETQSIPGIVDIVASYDTLGVYVEPKELNSFDLQCVLDRLIPSTVPHAQIHKVPICYHLGEDFDSVCTELSLDPLEFIKCHSSVEYCCYAVGFVPGFPYLGYLPSRLQGVRRLSSPRLRVPKGAIGIAHDQTGIYPGGSPGGWKIVGVTPLEIVDLQDNYFPIKPGDSVRFFSVGVEEFESRVGERL